VSTNENEMSAELEQIAIELALGAADVVRSARSQRLSVGSKSTSTDLVTAADRESERWLVGQLATRRPDDGVLGEEGASRDGSSGVRWLLDPIDGTVNFVLGLPHYAVSVAAEVAGKVVAGAVCNPVSAELFHARQGGGAFLADTQLAGPRPVPLAQAVVGTGFGYDPAQRSRQVAVVGALLPQIADIRRLGSASLDLCAVAAGRLDAYFEAGLNTWDYAAGALIATEAGCVVTGLRGRPPNGHLVVACAPARSAEFVAVLEGLGADLVSS
jgi:myo-inositol-1(or 4)-monophosphatase